MYRKQINAIEEEGSVDGRSASLNMQSEIKQNSSDVIQQYENLQFSDEHSNGHPLQNSSEQGQLSADKLQFLGVHKFPGFYSKKIKDISETRQAQSHSRQAYTQSNGFYSRKRKNQQKNNNRSFNIDSFLNSRPSNKNRIDDHDLSDKINKALKEKKQKKINDNFRISQRQQYNIQTRNQRIQNQIQNEKVKRFIQNYKKKRSNDHQAFEMSLQQPNQSISLITIPEHPEIERSNQRTKDQRIKCLKNKDWADIVEQNKIHQFRFDQAKINFLDNFLPESLKISKNPYNFFKYTQSKNYYNNMRIV